MQVLSYAILAYVNESSLRAAHLGDFALRPRTLLVTAVALPIGGASALAAFCLLRLIGLITNAVFGQRLSTAMTPPGAASHPWWLILLALALAIYALGRTAYTRPEKHKLVTATIVVVALVVFPADGQALAHRAAVLVAAHLHRHVDGLPGVAAIGGAQDGAVADPRPGVLRPRRPRSDRH